MIAVNWKFCLAILTCNVVFMSSSYTMLIPFLPMYLTRELGVDAASVNIWSGVVFSSTFLISAIMAPIWGRMADRRGKRLMAIRASLLLSISYFLMPCHQHCLGVNLLRRLIERLPLFGGETQQASITGMLACCLTPPWDTLSRGLL